MNGYVYSRHYYLFILHGGSCCLRLLFLQQETFVGGIYFGRTFPSGLGCGNVYFCNVCKSVSYTHLDVYKRQALFVADSAADQSFGMHLCFSDFVIEKESVIVLTVVHHQIGFRFELYGIIFICRFYYQMEVS